MKWIPLTLAALVTLLPGCVRLPRSPYPVKQFYVLEVVRGGETASSAQRSTLEVSRFRASPGVEGKELVYRRDDERYETDFYNELFRSPGSMVTEQVRRWLTASALFEHVLPEGSRVEADYTLEGNITTLYGDFREVDAPRAVIGLQLFLLRPGDSGMEILLRRDDEQSEPIPAATPQELIRGFERALTRVLAAFEEEIRGRFDSES